MAWSIELLDDPLRIVDDDSLLESRVVHASCPLSYWSFAASAMGQRVAKVAFADFVARHIATLAPVKVVSENGQNTMCWESLLEAPQRVHHGSSCSSSTEHLLPFILERTDVVATLPDENLHVYVRLLVYGPAPQPTGDNAVADAAYVTWLQSSFNDCCTFSDAQTTACMTHVATAVFQDTLRSQLVGKAVAFVADGSILPRRSGASMDPMASPPAIPFAAPTGSTLGHSVSVDMGELGVYLKKVLPLQQHASEEASVSTNSTPSTITLRGLLVPLGVSLIVGGGYHGKSTLLRCIAAGVYNKIPHDGRAFCVTVADALSIRAEDGRYVSRCNVSAFLSNLPAANTSTQQFSSAEASGSTSQAANVVDAMEMGSTAFLVDEDVSAANFMARDGRMRALVMDESITPLLYRVNGMFHTLGISTVVVVGGVGDWLDVPDAVLLMDKYVCKDATEKARSISKQFSHGHVQYGGRGVVHRLEWDKSTTPRPRRPVVDDYNLSETVVSLMSGSNAIMLHRKRTIQSETATTAVRMDSEPFIDMSRIEQLLGKKGQLLGCGLGVAWLLQAATNNPDRSLRQLLEDFDKAMDTKGGLIDLLLRAEKDAGFRPSWSALLEHQGCAFRPRRFEVGQAILRLRSVAMEELPIEDDGSEAAARAEAERRRQELLQIWHNRRSKKS